MPTCQRMAFFVAGLKTRDTKSSGAQYLTRWAGASSGTPTARNI